MPPYSLICAETMCMWKALVPAQHQTNQHTSEEKMFMRLLNKLINMYTSYCVFIFYFYFFLMQFTLPFIIFPVSVVSVLRSKGGTPSCCDLLGTVTLFWKVRRRKVGVKFWNPNSLTLLWKHRGKAKCIYDSLQWLSSCLWLHNSQHEEQFDKVMAIIQNEHKTILKMQFGHQFVEGNNRHN